MKSICFRTAIHLGYPSGFQGSVSSLGPRSSWRRSHVRIQWDSKYHERKAHFGLKEGVLHYVFEVDTGLACNCTCPDPACAKPLIARNLPSPARKRAPYFAHASQTPGCGGRGNVEALLSAPAN